MSSSDDENIHICGRCKTSFTDLNLYLAHKKARTCRKRSVTSNDHGFKSLTLYDLSEVAATLARANNDNENSVTFSSDVIIPNPARWALDDTVTSHVESSGLLNDDDSLINSDQSGELNNSHKIVTIPDHDYCKSKKKRQKRIFTSKKKICYADWSSLNSQGTQGSPTILDEGAPALEKLGNPDLDVPACNRAGIELSANKFDNIKNRSVKRRKRVDYIPEGNTSYPHSLKSQSESPSIETSNDEGGLQSKKTISTPPRNSTKKSYQYPKRLKCTFCKLPFENQRKLNSHQVLKHRHFCSARYCKLRFTSQLNLQKHVRNHHPTQSTVKCPVCSRLLSCRIWNWIDHHEKLHTPQHSRKKCDVNVLGQIPNIDMKPKPEFLSCPICCRLITHTANYAKHLELHKVWIQNDQTEFSKRVSSCRMSTSPEKVTASNKARVKSSSQCSSRNAKESNSGYQCPSCSEVLDTFEMMKFHNHERHNMVQVYRCIDHHCLKIFENVEDYVNHAILHPQLSFICRECNDHFNVRGFLMSHKRTMHRSETISDIRSEKCDRIFDNPENLAGHEVREDHQYPCSFCQECFKTTKLLKCHVSTRHQKMAKLCEICGKSFNDKLNLKRHLHRHEGITKDKTCPQCGRTFEVVEYLNRHIRTVHMNWRHFQCTESGCSKKFTTKSKFERHMETHNTDRSYKCPTCGKMYRSRDVLDKHCKIYCFHFCGACNEKFVQQNEIENHTREKHPDYLYICKFCNSVCETLTDLRSHIGQQHKKFLTKMIAIKLEGQHIEDRPLMTLQLRKNAKVFRCEVPNCNKEFLERKKLTDHIETHSAIKNIRCQYCDYVTKTHDSYRKHKKRTHTCKIYPCDAVIGNAEAMNLHIQVAHKQYAHQFVCHLCLKVKLFQQDEHSEYLAHLQTHYQHRERRRKREQDKCVTTSPDIGIIPATDVTSGITADSYEVHQMSNLQSESSNVESEVTSLAVLFQTTSEVS